MAIKTKRSSENPWQSGFQTTFVIIFGDVFSTEQPVHIGRFFAVRQADVDAENAVELAALDFGVVVVHQRQTFFKVAQCHRVALVRLGVFAAFRRGVRVFDADVDG